MTWEVVRPIGTMERLIGFLDLMRNIVLEDYSSLTFLD